LQIVGDPEGGISVLDAHAPMNKKNLSNRNKKNDETLLEMVCLLQIIHAPHRYTAARRKHTRGHIVLGPSDAGTVARAPSSIGSDAALSSGGGASIYAAARVSAYV
jgi:hypothetical protein